jgi:hypothetical protein
LGGGKNANDQGEVVGGGGRTDERLMEENIGLCSDSGWIKLSRMSLNYLIMLVDAILPMAANSG